jgi:hypothetical protein
MSKVNWFFGRCYAEILTKPQNFLLKPRLTGDYKLNFSTNTQMVVLMPVITALPAAMRYILNAESYDRRGARGKSYCIIAGSAVKQTVR